MADKIDESTPQGTESPTLGDDRIREFKVNVNALLEVEHDISDDATTSGFHGTQITGKADTAISTPPTGYGRFGFKVIDGLSELFYRDDAGNEVQITSEGKVLLTANVIGNDTYLVATDNAGTGTVNMIKISASDLVQFGANVAAYTMAGNIAMGSNKITGLADATASGDAVHLGQFSPVAYAGGESVTFPNGLILKQGEATSLSPTQAVSFSTPFPTACLNVQATISVDRVSRFSVMVYSLTANGFTIEQPDSDNCFWSAIGY